MKAGIVGATGYAGQELVRLLVQHPEVEVAWISSNSYKDKAFNEVYGNFTKIYHHRCVKEELHQWAREVDVIFLATPHGLSASLIDKAILSQTVIIDLSADFRLNDEKTYKTWYGETHQQPDLLQDAVYGLCEIYRETIKTSTFIANPGCYPTASILGFYPLLKEKLIHISSIIIDAKSGVSGAGRSLKLGSHFNEVNESTKAYGVAVHRHTCEIEEQLSLAANESLIVNFTPHLIPMNRGILSTIYGQLNEAISASTIREVYGEYYKNAPFVRLLEEGCYPETRWVRGSNYCDINFKIDPRTNRVIVLSAIDNLVKGAAGQAVQNMNLIFGMDETLGLKQIPMFP